jgi:hypothetical protein
LGSHPGRLALFAVARRGRFANRHFALGARGGHGQSPAHEKLRIVIGLRLPLAQAAEAHRRMEGRETVGKILLTVD